MSLSTQFLLSIEALCSGGDKCDFNTTTILQYVFFYVLFPGGDVADEQMLLMAESLHGQSQRGGPRARAEEAVEMIMSGMFGGRTVLLSEKGGAGDHVPSAAGPRNPADDLRSHQQQGHVPSAAGGGGGPPRNPADPGIAIEIDELNELNETIITEEQKNKVDRVERALRARSGAGGDWDRFEIQFALMINDEWNVEKTVDRLSRGRG